MKPDFGKCIFKYQEKPSDCEFGMKFSECSATEWELIDCFLKHYGSLLVADAPLRLFDAFTHVIIDNESENIAPS